MPNYHFWIKAYMDSASFEEQLMCFFEDFEHDVCYYTAEHEQEYYYSEPYVKYLKRWEECLSSLPLGFPNMRSYSWLHRYFSRVTTEEELFVIVFALWWGFKKEQLALLMDVTPELCRHALHYLICSPKATQLPDADALLHFRYEGCYRRNDGQWVAGLPVEAPVSCQ